jgi:hypothetical protein
LVVTWTIKIICVISESEDSYVEVDNFSSTYKKDEEVKASKRDLKDIVSSSDNDVEDVFNNVLFVEDSSHEGGNQYGDGERADGAKDRSRLLRRSSADNTSGNGGLDAISKSLLVDIASKRRVDFET